MILAAARAHLRELLLERGLSQQQFSADLGRSQAWISQLLTGHRRGRDLDVWQAMAAYFDKPLSQFIAEVERPRVTTPKERIARMAEVYVYGIDNLTEPPEGSTYFASPVKAIRIATHAAAMRYEDEEPVTITRYTLADGLAPLVAPMAIALLTGRYWSTDSIIRWRVFHGALKREDRHD